MPSCWHLDLGLPRLQNISVLCKSPSLWYFGTEAQRSDGRPSQAKSHYLQHIKIMEADLVHRSDAAISCPSLHFQLESYQTINFFKAEART